MEYHFNYDAIFKWMATVFTGETLEVLGISTGPIVEVRGLEPVTLEVKEEHIDLLLRDDHDRYYHLEEERNLSLHGLYRFASQHFLVAEQIGSKALASVIIASGTVTPQTSIETLSGRFSPTIINLEQRDGEECLSQMRRQEKAINAVELIFLPLYGVHHKDRGKFAEEVIQYTKEMYLQKKIRLEFLGALLIFCNKLVAVEVLQSVWQEVSMLHVFKLIEEMGEKKGREKEQQVMERERQAGLERMQATLREMVLTLLEIRFGEEGTALFSEVAGVSEVARLEALKELLKVSKEITPVRNFLRPGQANHPGP